MEQENDMNEDIPAREQFPTGWLVLAKNESAAKIIDALLDLPPYREFNQTELADMAGVSRQSVRNHKELLLSVGVIEHVQNTSRYRFDPKSEVSKAIIQLDGAMNSAGLEVEA